MKGIVKTIEASPERFSPPIASAMAILQLIYKSKNGLTAEEIAPKVGKSESYVKQVLQALRKGNVEFVVSHSDAYQATGRPTNVWGAAK